MLLSKPGARVSGLWQEILLAVVAALAVLDEFGCDFVVTTSTSSSRLTTSTSSFIERFDEAFARLIKLAKRLKLLAGITVAGALFPMLPGMTLT